MIPPTHESGYVDCNEMHTKKSKGGSSRDEGPGERGGNREREMRAAFGFKSAHQPLALVGSVKDLLVEWRALASLTARRAHRSMVATSKFAVDSGGDG